MCRSASSPLLLLLPMLLLLLLLLGVVSVTARVHVQSSPGDVGGVTGQNIEQDDYRGHQVLQVNAADNITRSLLRSYEDNPDVDFWTPVSELTPTVDVLVSPDVRRQLTDELTRLGASYTVNIEDVQAAIEWENPTLSQAERELQRNREYKLSWSAYHSLADHHQYLDFLNNNQIGDCRTFSIGKSFEGRDLKGIKCGKGSEEVWIDGGIHAREWVSPAVVSCLAREFSERSINHEKLLNKYTVYIIPVLNADGYEYTWSKGPGRRRLWRKTRSIQPGSSCIGSDPNRNFDVSWGGAGTSRNPCSDIYPGPRPFSEPETAAVRDFLLKHSGTMKMYFSFHSYSQMLFVPYAYSTERPSDYWELRRVAQLGEEALRSVHGEKYQVGQASRLLYAASGGSDDWAKKKAGIKYSYTFELRDKGRYGFLLPAYHIEPNCKEVVAAVSTMINEAI